MDTQPSQQQNNAPQSQPVQDTQPTPQSSNKKAIVIVIITLALLAIGTGAYWYFTQQKPIACTQEAKQCPDGSYVGRTGPNCEFMACPADETASWQTYRNEEYGFELKYPNNFQNSDKPVNDKCGFASFVDNSKSAKDIHELRISVRCDRDFSALSEFKEYLDNLRQEKNQTFNIIKEQQLTKNGAPSILRQVHLIGPDIAVFEYYILKNKTAIFISAYLPDNKFSEQSSQLFNQILSTFKFTK